jgi:hypothetical protein
MDAKKRKRSKMVFLKRFVFVTYPVLIATCLFCLARIEPPHTQEELADARDTYLVAVEIRSALKAFFDDMGQHPVSLEELVPKYIGEIRPPKQGDTGWIYTKGDKDDYDLQIAYDSYSGLSYPVAFSYVDLGWHRKEQRASDLRR